MTSDTATKQPTEAIYQLKVTIKGTKPPIWRRIELPSNATLKTLHETILAAFGWYGYHLHEFEISGESYGDPSLDDDFFSRTIHPESKTRLDKVASVGATFTYTYDFGDNWEHAIKVEKLLPVDQNVRYPRCTAAKRACPPEDCGGVWGYQNFLEAIANPQHEEHDQMLEWIGGEFDPDFVDLTMGAEIDIKSVH